MSDEHPITLAAIVLSGGESTRMGKPKALLDFGGKPAIARILESARKAGITSRTNHSTASRFGAWL